MSAPVFVISLADSHERRRHAEAQCRELNLPWEFVDAVDCRNASLDDIADKHDPRKASRFGMRPLAPAEVGCYLSHLKVYELMRERGVRRAVVAEDDFRLDDAPRAARVIAALNASAPAFDIVQLGVHISRSPIISRYYARPIAADDDLLISRFQGIASGAYFYMIDLDYAEALLDLHRRLKIFMPVDIMLFDMVYAPRFAHVLCAKSNMGRLVKRRLSGHNSKLGSTLAEAGRVCDDVGPPPPGRFELWRSRLKRAPAIIRRRYRVWRASGRAWQDAPKRHYLESSPPGRKRAIYAKPIESPRT